MVDLPNAGIPNGGGLMAFNGGLMGYYGGVIGSNGNLNG